MYYFYLEMPKEKNKTLKYNHGEKPMNVLIIIYADLESLLQKMSTCHKMKMYVTIMFIVM